jgi:hypothetical protein
MARAWPLCCAVALGLSAAAGPGCKSDSDPGAAFIGRYCDIYKPCCTAAGLPGDGAACRALFASSSSPEAKYNATAGDECIAGLMQNSGQAGFCEGDLVPPSACARAFGGVAGSGCVQDGDCPPSAMGDVRCVIGAENGTQVSKCQIQSAGQQGSTPCLGSVRGGVVLYSGSSGTLPDQGYLCDAAAGLRCDGTACVALTAQGAPCELSSDCAEADFCDATTGTCTARKPIGSACIDQALECADGAYCQTPGMTCVAQMDVGAACTDNVQCLTGNCPNGACEATPTGGANALCGG